MSRFINPFTDVGFKIIFGQEVNKDLLIDFLNQLLKGEYEVTDLTFADKEMHGDSVDDKSCIYDIFCKTSKGEMIIVEMQNSRQVFFRDRAVYYVSKAMASQGRRGGGWNYELKAVIGIFFMNFVMVRELSAEGPVPARGAKFRTDVILADKDDGVPFSDKVRMIFLQLPLFTKERADECETDFERWIYILKHMETLDRMPFEAKKAVYARLAEICASAKLSAKDRDRYEASLKAYRDAKALQYYYDNAESLAFAQGEAQGEAQGMAQGETKAKTSIAKTLYQMGMPVAKIAEATHLTEAEVLAILR